MHHLNIFAFPNIPKQYAPSWEDLTPCISANQACLGNGLLGNLECILIDRGVDFSLCRKALHHATKLSLRALTTGGDIGNDLTNVDTFVGTLC